jgi:hypothetical protein
MNARIEEHLKPRAGDAEAREYFRKHVAPVLNLMTEDERIGRKLFPAQYGAHEVGGEAIPPRSPQK